MTSIIAAMQDSLLLIESSKIDWKKIERLPNLKLIASTGLRNAAIDLEAAAKHGIEVVNTRYGILRVSTSFTVCVR